MQKKSIQFFRNEQNLPGTEPFVLRLRHRASFFFCILRYGFQTVSSDTDSSVKARINSSLSRAVSPFA